MSKESAAGLEDVTADLTRNLGVSVDTLVGVSFCRPSWAVVARVYGRRTQRGSLSSLSLRIIGEANGTSRQIRGSLSQLRGVGHVDRWRTQIVMDASGFWQAERGSGAQTEYQAWRGDRWSNVVLPDQVTGRNPKREQWQALLDGMRSSAQPMAISCEDGAPRSAYALSSTNWILPSLMYSTAEAIGLLSWYVSNALDTGADAENS